VIFGIFSNFLHIGLLKISPESLFSGINQSLMSRKQIIPMPGAIPRGWGLMAPMMEAVQVDRQLFGARVMTLEDKDQQAIEIVRNHVSIAMGTALIPFPGAGFFGVASVQMNMLRQLAMLYEAPFMNVLGKNLLFAMLGAGTAGVGASLVRIIPGIGLLAGDLSLSLFSGASTFALGRMMANYFHHGGTLETLDLGWARRQYKDRMGEGREIAIEISKKDQAAEQE
jgi:uncharacterized protein (DUF697 family)